MQIALFTGTAVHDWKARLEPVTYRMPFPDRRFRVGEILLRHGWPLVTRRDQTRRTFLLPRIIVVYRVLHASITERFLHVLYVWKTFWQTSRSSRYGTRLLFCVKEARQSERTLFCSFAVLCLFLCWPTATHYRLLSLTFCSTFERNVCENMPPLFKFFITLVERAFFLRDEVYRRFPPRLDILGKEV